MGVTETNGVWARATTIGAPTATFARGNFAQPPETSLNGLVCTSPGDCVAVGSYSTFSKLNYGAASSQPAGLIETDGVWGQPARLGLPPGASTGEAFLAGKHRHVPWPQTASLNSVACLTASNCVAVGAYVDKRGVSQAMTVSETNGVWSHPTQLALPPGAVLPSSGFGASLRSVTCPDATTCYAVGLYTYDRSNDSKGLIATDTDGVWTASSFTVAPAQIRHPTSGLSAITCLTTSDCYAFGFYVPRGRGFTDDDGRWQPVAAAGDPTFRATSVACAAPGKCLAVGVTRQAVHEGPVAPQATLRASVLEQSSSGWGPSVNVQLPANASRKLPSSYLDRVACPVGGPCVASGEYFVGHTPTQTLSQTIVITWQPHPRPEAR
ncbi:MAG: hypothetical protein ABSG64_14250 [Solirubrobacteraceae bacterium]|jgi:hypothetical protein